MLHTVCLKKGSGVPLVFLHGLLGTSSDWEPVVEYLPDCLCIGVDLPGHGKSPFTKRFELPIDAKEFHLIGYSMGARLAMDYAARHPERIGKLILASVHPGLESEEEKQKRLKSDALWAQLLFELPIDEFLSRWYDQALFQPFKPDFAMRKNQNLPALAQALMHYSLARQPRFELSEVLVGERDVKFRTLHKKPILIPGAGHMVHLENPKAVADEIKRRIE